MNRLALLVAALAAAPAALAWESPGAVFTQSNDPAGNTVLAFSRARDGSLRPAGATATGGLGAGGGLGSQGALAFARRGDFLLAVSAGSNEVSAFRVRGTSLHLTGVAPSGGTMPVSVTEHGGVVYVVNAGSGDVSGLRLDSRGRLTPIPGSTRPLSSPGAGPAQISFDPSGEVLVVSEKAANAFSVYQVGDDGLATGPAPFPSEGATPFGFAFGRRGTLVVSEAFGGAPGASAVSSYVLEEGGLVTGSASVPNGQGAACWVAVAHGGRFAYVTNTGSDDVSLYEVDRCGRIRLLQAEAAPTEPGGTPIDVAASKGDRFLYVLDSGTDAIVGYEIGRDGSLAPLGVRASGLPPSSVGLVAR